MEISSLAFIIGSFNFFSASAMAFFAIIGIFVLSCRHSMLNIFRKRTFVQTFCVAAFFAFVLEVTVFNFQFYLRFLNATGEVNTMGVSPSDSTIILTSDSSIVAELQYGVKKDSSRIANAIAFKNLNRRVSSIFIKPDFGSAEHLEIYVSAFDEESTRMVVSKKNYKGFPHDNHIPVQLCGKVSEITVFFHESDMRGTLAHIAINRPIPLYFSGLRPFAISCLLFATISLVRKNLRAKIAQVLFEYKFNPASKKQNSIYALFTMLLILFSFVSSFTSTNKFFREEYMGDRQYNMFLVDALLAGRTYLDAGHPEMLLVAERPYDLHWLEKNNYPRDKMWYSDWVYYKGKHYCYFGIVPAVILFAPYKALTGEYLPNHAGIFIFCAISIILMAMLWRHCVKKYMPDMRFAFYLFSFLALFFTSGLFCPLRFTRFYSIVSSAGFMFALAGILLLLKSVEHGRASHLKVFFACLCLALTVGCRPNLLPVSILVPIVLWKYRSFRLAAPVMVPYVLVAIPLCFYNYIRFGSITEFGLAYNMTNMNVAAYALLEPMGKVISTFTASMSYLLSINKYTFAFPYVECIPLNDKLSVATRLFYDKGCGMINFPIILGLLFYFKSIFTKHKPKPKIFYLSSAFLIIAAITILLNSWVVGFSGRYTIDFAFYIIFPSIIGAHYWCGAVQSEPQARDRLKAAYVALFASIFVGLCLFATNVTNDVTPGDPVLYRYLRYSLGVIGSF